MIDMDKMAERLKAARLACGLSQRKAAEKIGITRDVISKAECGVNVTQTASIAALADVYGVSIDWLLGRDVGEMVTFFHTEEQLSALTGLSHDALWEAGFDLDDWDYGFVTVEEWPDTENLWDAKCPYYRWSIASMLENTCRIEHYKWHGRHYHMRYHA